VTLIESIEFFPGLRVYNVRQTQIFFKSDNLDVGDNSKRRELCPHLRNQRYVHVIVHVFSVFYTQKLEWDIGGATIGGESTCKWWGNSMRPKRMSRRQRGNSESAESDQKYHQILSNNLFFGGLWNYGPCLFCSLQSPAVCWLTGRSGFSLYLLISIGDDHTAWDSRTSIGTIPKCSRYAG